MEDVCSAHRAETKPELGALITGADVLGGRAEDPVWARETGERRKYATRPLLACKAMANTDNLWLTFNFDAKLAAVT